MRLQYAFWLLCAGASIVFAHGDDEMDMDGMNSEPTPPVNPKPHDQFDMPSYIGLDTYSGLMLAHIVFMVLSWFFVLPLGKLYAPRRNTMVY